MFKIKVFVVFFILFAGFFSVGFANEDNGEYVCFHSFDVYDDDLRVETIEVPINIGSYDILKTESGDVVSIDGFGQNTLPGEPKLPVKIISIAIPKDSIPLKLSYRIDKQVQLSGRYNIRSASPVLLDNNDNIEESLNEYNSNYLAVYSSDDPFPSEIVSFEGISGYRDFDMIDIKINPFVYYPLSKKLVFYSDFEIKIDVVCSENYDDSLPLVNISMRNIDFAEDIIYNFRQLEYWYEVSYDTGQYEFVIITLDDLVDAVDPLVKWEIEKGRTVNVVTISWIESEYPGIDLAEKIRNFLRDKYLGSEWGIEDVLLVGHYSDIPLRMMWQGLLNSEKPETDFYYAELSRPDNESWDSNHNMRYGDTVDEIDFYAEVNVGRIPWSDYDTVLHICEKSVSYEENTDPSFKNNILLLAAMVDDQTDGAVYTEYIANSTIHPWMTYWSKTRLYERDSIYPMDSVLNHVNVLSTWSNGKYGLVTWNAHGSPEGSYVRGQPFIHINDCDNLNDDYPAIVSAASCSNSDTDYLNIGQALLRQGAVGFLGANKVAYYCSGWQNPNDGSDQSFKYFFTSKVSSGEYTQGEALQYAIREMYTMGLWTQLRYETFIHSSLWGNPDLSISSSIENNPPLKPSKPEGPDNGRKNREYTYTCDTSDPDNDDIYYCWSWGDDVIEWLGPYKSGETVTSTHIWESEGSFSIKVKSKDIYGSESDWSEPLSIAMPKSISIYNPWLFRLIQRFPILEFLL